MPKEKQRLLDEKDTAKKSPVQAMLEELRKEHAVLAEQSLDEFVFHSDQVKQLMQQIDEQENTSIEEKQALARKFLDAYAMRRLYWQSENEKSRKLFQTNVGTAGLLAGLSWIASFALGMAAIMYFAPMITIQSVLLSLSSLLIVPFIVMGITYAATLAILHYCREPRLEHFSVGRALFDRTNPNYKLNFSDAIWKSEQLSETEIAHTKALLKNCIEQQLNEQVKPVTLNYITNGQVEAGQLQQLPGNLFEPKQKKPAQSLLTKSGNIRKLTLSNDKHFGNKGQFEKEQVVIQAVKESKEKQGLTFERLHFFAARYRQVGGKAATSKPVCKV